MNGRNSFLLSLFFLFWGLVSCSNNSSTEDFNSCADSVNVSTIAFVKTQPYVDSVGVSADSLREVKSAYTRRIEMKKLLVYVPLYNSVDLVCGAMPSISDTNVIFCAEAAFTGQLLSDFKHKNVAGDHVSGGVRYKGYSCKRNTGAFVFYEGKYRFLYDNYSFALDLAQDAGGMGFGQEMLIFEGKKVPCLRADSNINEFRALCELNGSLCVIDSKGKLSFGDFIYELLSIGVRNALYLDMGQGWNYSWWRDDSKTLHMIHDKRIKYTTNWITFYGN